MLERMVQYWKWIVLTLGSIDTSNNLKRPQASVWTKFFLQRLKRHCPKIANRGSIKLGRDRDPKLAAQKADF